MLHFKNGIYDISNEEYHAADAVSRSKLMLLEKSPAHLYYELFGKSDKNKSTKAMNFGSAFHTLLLEPHLFEKEFFIIPHIDRRTKDGKEKYNALLSDNALKMPLTEEEAEKLDGMIKSIQSSNIACIMLEKCEAEKSIFWTDEDTGIQFKCRPDAWSQDLIIDIKTTQDASYNSFVFSARKYGYYLQAAMIYEACKKIGKPITKFVIIAGEKDAPYAHAIYCMSEDSIEYGMRLFNKYKIKLARCLEKNEWPMYEVKELEVPSWAIKEIEEGEEK